MPRWIKSIYVYIGKFKANPKATSFFKIYRDGKPKWEIGTNYGLPIQGIQYNVQRFIKMKESIKKDVSSRVSSNDRR